MGITIGNCSFEKTANHRDTAAQVITDALGEVSSLQLLVVVLPEKTQFYGTFF